MSKITNISVRMYRMGTGDCFILKYFAGDTEKFKMMIDCGTWSGSRAKLKEYVDDIKTYVDNHIDLLVITHEHLDHVYGFEACRELFTDNFKVDRIWMGWTENDKSDIVKAWQKDYGDKKKALAFAASALNKIANSTQAKDNAENEFNGAAILHASQNFSGAIDELNALHNNLNANKEYIGPLVGMNVVKTEIAKDNIDYLEPGEIIDGLPNLEGIKFYVLGPPKKWKGQVKVEEGPEGESYEHNNKLAECDSFAAAIMDNFGNFIESENNCPFDDDFVSTDKLCDSGRAYFNKEEQWRCIENDWLNSAGTFALRINSITNNLSLALAIEFKDSGKVLLFPGDAEYGSWASWHTIPWNEQCRNGKNHFTEDLLSRTIFYKVAHHLSHHGTAERLGMQMMTNPDLVSMATLDYGVISPRWKNTMPNKEILKALISQCKGRLIVMNEDKLFYDKENTILLSAKIKKERMNMSENDLKNFEENYEEHDLYMQYNVKGI